MMSAVASEKKRLVLRRYIAAQENHHLTPVHQHCESVSAAAPGAATPALKRKRGGSERLNDAQRLEIIRQRRQPEAPSLRKLAGAFNVSERSIRNVMLAATTIEQRAAHADVRAQLRTFRSAAPRFPELEERVFQWLQARHAARATPTPSAIIEQARAIAAELGIPASAFKASSGWFERFRKRRRLADVRMSVGGSGDASASGARTAADLATIATTSSYGSGGGVVSDAQRRADGNAAAADSRAATERGSTSAEALLLPTEDPASATVLLAQLAGFEDMLREFQAAHPSELGRLQQCLASASEIRHHLLAAHANLQERSVRANANTAVDLP